MKFKLQESSIDFTGYYRKLDQLISSYQSTNHKRGLTELRDCLASIAGVNSADYILHHKNRLNNDNNYWNLVLVPNGSIHHAAHRQCLEASIEDLFYKNNFNYKNNTPFSEKDFDWVKRNIEAVYDNYIYYLINRFPYKISGCIDIKNLIDK